MVQFKPSFWSVHRELGATLSVGHEESIKSAHGFSFFFFPSETKPLSLLLILGITFMR